MNDLDFSGLSEFTLEDLQKSGAPAKGHGKPLMIPLDEIEQDPDGVRAEYDPKALKELADSIKEKGVKTPISLRSKNDEGKYVINHGSRRVRASRLAGKTDIPAFIDDVYDSYDQASENIQRDSLKPLEIAAFIARKMREGDTQATISRNLGKPRSWVTMHAALREMPQCVSEAYTAGRCQDATALYLLTKNYTKHPDEIEARAKEDRSALTQSAVKAFAQQLNAPPAPEPPAEPSSEPPAPPTSAENAIPHAMPAEQSPEVQPREEPPELEIAPGATEASKSTRTEEAGEADTTAAQWPRPAVLVEHEGDSGHLLLDRASSAGHVWIHTERGEVREVQVSTVQLVGVLLD